MELFIIYNLFITRNLLLLKNIYNIGTTTNGIFYAITCIRNWKTICGRSNNESNKQSTILNIIGKRKPCIYSTKCVDVGQT